MRTFLTSGLLICAMMISANLPAQQPDPFADPFADPKGGADPKGSDPKGSDPFGSDPFAPSRRARPAAAAKDKPGNSATKTAVKPTRPSDADRWIRGKLLDKTTMTLIEMPLEDAVGALSESHDIPIVVDGRAMEEIGLSPDTPVNLDLKNVSLRSFLRLMLRDLDMTYTVKNEVLLITTMEAAERNQVLQTYVFPESLTDRAEKIVTVLTATVQPDQWSTLGGPCSVGVIDNVLVVSASERVHEDVQDFLEKVEQAYAKRMGNQ